MKRYLPNTITSLNLVFGMLAMIMTMQNKLTLAGIFIFCALLADILDGRVARALGVVSSIGKELDSLCDCVSFGVAPALMLYAYAFKELNYLVMLVAICFALCGALRLARFNVNTEVVKGCFVGMPIPAAGCALVTLVISDLNFSLWFICLYTIFFAFLMVSKIKYPDFKGGKEKFFVLPLLFSVLIVLCVTYFVLLNTTNFLGLILLLCFLVYAFYGILNQGYNKVSLNKKY